MAPTILIDVEETSDLMQEEIFGPLLPVPPIDGIEAFTARMRELEKPLALCVFTADADAIRTVERETSSGAFGIKVRVAHAGSAVLPFCGVGESGMAAYRGRHSFEAFNHRKAVLSKPTQIDTLSTTGRPIPANHRSIVRLLLAR